MDSRTPRDLSKDSQREAFPLITPSASPPVSRSFFPTARTFADTPPAKRARRTATPSASFTSSTPAPSLSTVLQDPTFDLHSARKASSFRVLDVWSQLAERYTRRLDQDDILDLRTGSVIKDRGVLRATSHQYNIGCFADGDVNDAGSEGAGAQTEGEDDADEIDAFAPEADISDELEDRIRNVPPVQKLDPADAEDLRQFMEEERLRKELCGEEEESGSDDLGTGGTDYEDGVNEEAEVGGVTSEWEEKDDLDVGESDRASADEEDDDVNVEGLQIVSGDEVSEDELNDWDIDEASAVYLVSPDFEAEDEAEAVEPLPNESGVLSDGSRPQQSEGGWWTVEAAEDNNGRGDPTGYAVQSEEDNSPSLARTRLRRIRSMSGEGLQSEGAFTDETPINPLVSRESHITQLYTPPRSQSSPSIIEGSDVIDALDACPSSSPARPKSKPKHKNKDVFSSVQSLQSDRQTDVTQPRTSSRLYDKSRKSKLTAEVVITARPARSNRKQKFSLTVSKDLQREQIIEEASPTNEHLVDRIPAKDKGKSRAQPNLSLPARVPSVPLDNEKPSTLDSQKDTRNVDLLEHPVHSTPTTRGTKRKRMVSGTVATFSDGGDKEARTYRPGSSSPLQSHRSLDGFKSEKSERSQRSSSPEASDEGSEPPQRSREHRRSQSRSRTSRARSRSRAPVYPPWQGRPTYPPPTNSHSELPAFDPMQGVQAQYLLAQAMHHLSYLISANGPPNPASPAPPSPQGWPPQPPSNPFMPSYPSPYSQSPWPPYTPSHRSRRKSKPPSSSSSPMGPPALPSSPSTPSSSPLYTTPTHSRHPHPFSFDPSFSRATLPPSSPEPSSPISSPEARSKSRSKSRGRRVSFRLDDETLEARDNTMSGNVELQDEEWEIQDNVNVTHRSTSYAYGPKSVQSNDARRDVSAERASSRAQSTSRNKGKARQEDVSDEPSTASVSHAEDPGKRTERGRTPGPPSRPTPTTSASRREKSQSTHHTTAGKSRR